MGDELGSESGCGAGHDAAIAGVQQRSQQATPILLATSRTVSFNAEATPCLSKPNELVIAVAPGVIASPNPRPIKSLPAVAWGRSLPESEQAEYAAAEAAMDAAYGNLG